MSQAANYNLEIIQPQPSLNTANRYYKAYPGIEYNVKVGVFGGTFPFVYSLTTYPSGMTIDASTGVITWSNPTASGSPHNITVSVTDDESTTVTRSWTLTVTTTGFYFLDATNGNDASAGAIDTPWKTIGGMYKNSKTDDTYAGGFLYFRTGTYLTKGTNIVFEDLCRIPLTSNDKPVVWMGYPGETAIIDPSTAYIAMYSNAGNIYFDNLSFTPLGVLDTNVFGLRIDSGEDNIVVRRISFHELPYLSGSYNQSFFMMSNGETKSNYILFSENTCDTVNGGYCFLGYYTNKVVAEYNTLQNMTNAHGIAPKMNNTYWSIRKNTAITNMNTSGSIWIDTYATTNNMDISFNNINDADVALEMGLEPSGYSPVYSYRNTYQGTVNVLNYSSGTISFIQDIIINANTPKITYSGGSTPTQTNLLSGVTADNIVNTSGILQGSYRTTYLGNRGWEIGTDVTAPTLSNITPSGDTVYATTKQLSVTTNEAATCRYHASSTTWADMTQMSSTGGTTHSVSVNVSVGANSFKVVCQDAAANESTAGTWSFTVLAEAAGAKTISIGAGSQTISSGGSQTIIMQ
jgi:hypothetical protein